MGDISVDEPDGPLDELYFRKLVAWLYCLLFESVMFFRFSKNLLRATNPGALAKLQRVSDVVHAARTVQNHTLRSHKKSDLAIRRRYDAWILEASEGDSRGWAGCIVTLTEEVTEAVCEIEAVWRARCAEQWSRNETVDAYLAERRGHWEAYEFDEFVESAAKELELTDLDCVGFRNSNGRLERWRGLAGLFPGRSAAATAIRRAIRRELVSVFGTTRELSASIVRPGSEG